MADLLTPQQFVDALKSGKYKPAKGAFMRTRSQDGETGYCCLGVYAEECGLGAGHFVHLFNPESVRDEVGDDPGIRYLPDGHWLFTRRQDDESEFQLMLAHANDGDLSDAYEQPIKLLEAFIASQAGQ